MTPACIQPSYNYAQQMTPKGVQTRPKHVTKNDAKMCPNMSQTNYKNEPNMIPRCVQTCPKHVPKMSPTCTENVSNLLQKCVHTSCGPQKLTW